MDINKKLNELPVFMQEKSGSLKNLNWKRCRRNNRFQG